MGSVTCGQVVLGYMGRQAEQAMESKVVSRNSSMTSILVPPFMFLLWLSSVMSCNLKDKEILSSPHLVWVMCFIIATKKPYEGSMHVGSIHVGSTREGSMRRGSTHVDSTHVDSMHVDSMHVEVRQHLEGVDSLPYLGPELTSSALVTGTFYLMSHLTSTGV